jgi:hypothetical protein
MERILRAHAIVAICAARRQPQALPLLILIKRVAPGWASIRVVAAETSRSA